MLSLGSLKSKKCRWDLIGHLTGFSPLRLVICVCDIIKSSKQMHYVENAKKLVNWCFEPSQPLRITSARRETFMKRKIVESTNKT